MSFLTDNLALFMVLALAALLFSGLPVALVLIAVALGLIGQALGEFPLVAYWNIPPRIYATLGENLLYPAVPCCYSWAAPWRKAASGGSF
jgi:TRAP-type mannitol/chloroaromatic compound transport system permease large subunit